jgi:probable rRNA maturation factor
MGLLVTGARLLQDDKDAALRAARGVWRAARLGKVDVGLTFVIDVEMRALNRRWRGKDRSTDVLSFPAWEGEAMPGDESVLGDLVISVETAARQAHAHGHPLATEVGVLVAHGLLHLLGLDHERSAAEADLQLSCELGLLDCAGLPITAGLIWRA